MSTPSSDTPRLPESEKSADGEVPDLTHDDQDPGLATSATAKKPPLRTGVTAPDGSPVLDDQGD